MIVIDNDNRTVVTMIITINLAILMIIMIRKYINK